jgi:PAS domain S-box-containing protein
LQPINKILVIEDNHADILLLKESLQDLSYSQFVVLERLADVYDYHGSGPELIFLDLHLPDSRGLETFIEVNKKFPDAAIIIMSGLHDDKMALHAMQEGAQDYLVKGEIEVKSLMKSIRYSIERKRSQKALREREEQYRVLVNSAPEALVVLDYETRKFVNVSESAVRFFKLPEEKLLELGPHDVSPLFQPNGKASAELAAQRIKEAAEGSQQHFEWTHMDADGKEIPCEVWLVRLPSENRILLRGSILDISERKNAEKEIRSLEETRKLIMNSALDAIVGMDPAGHIIVWTPRAEQIFGWKEEEVLGRTIAETIVPPSLRERHMQGLRRYTESRQPVILNKLIEIVAINREGKEFPVELTVAEIRNEKSFFFCAFIRDITDRKKAEDLLKQSSEQLRQLSAHLQNVREDERIAIAREIHDELGQQLTVLKMDISWLKRKLVNPDPRVLKKIEDLMHVIDQTVKTVRKISSDLRPSMLDDLGLVPALEWHSQEFEQRSGIKTTFVSALPEINLSTLETTTMFRIFQETLTNVARHADASKVEATLAMEDEKLVMRIRDNGKGFSIKDLANKRTLGILGMQERVAIIQGEYKIDSQPGSGTVVEVKVPVGHIVNEKDES